MAHVVVVGGGIIGTMHAWAARRRGHSVVQLDRDAEPSSASVRNFGLVWVSGRASGAELELALRARSLWEQIGNDVPGVGFRADGSLTVVHRSAELAVLEEVAARTDAAARDVRVVTATEARALNPAVRGDIAGALYCALDAVVEPGAVLPALRQWLRRDGQYQFLGGRTVVMLEPEGAAVDDTGQRHAGDLVIVCPGDAFELLGSGSAAPPLRRCRLQMLQTEPFGERLATSIADGDSLRYYPAFDVPALTDLPPAAPIVVENGMQLLVAQRANGELTIGDTHDYDEPFRFDLAEAPYRHLLERVEAILGVPPPPVKRRWAGVYSVLTAPDRIYWRNWLAPTIHCVTGLAGRGMTLSPAVAEDTFAAVGW